jgi:hypothetical protein
MAYSKAYQEVTAGRVREEEALGYLKDNKVTTLAGNFTTNRTGGSTQLPKITMDALRSENVGKTGSREDALDAFDAGSNNSSNA